MGGSHRSEHLFRRGVAPSSLRRRADQAEAKPPSLLPHCHLLPAPPPPSLPPRIDTHCSLSEGEWKERVLAAAVVKNKRCGYSLDLTVECTRKKMLSAAAGPAGGGVRGAAAAGLPLAAARGISAMDSLISL